MEFAPPNLSIAKLKRKMDISNLTLHLGGENHYTKGRFYMLWRNGNFIVIQAEPWCRPGVGACDDTILRPQYPEEHRAFQYAQEVIQTMLDTIVFDGEHNWAYLVRGPRDNRYRLVYKKRQLIHDCPIWTKVVELDDIEVTRITSPWQWEGVYEGNDVDVCIGWKDEWGDYISCESRGHKLMESLGLSHYFFRLEAHVSKNGVIVGLMIEPLVGRPVTPADRSAVFEAVADIQRHGIFLALTICDIYITERGVRFASASSAKYYQDRDALAEETKLVWKILTNIFYHMDEEPLRGWLIGSRSSDSMAFIIPRLPSPGRPISMTHGEAIIRWAWSVATSDDEFLLEGRASKQLHTLCGSPEYSPTRRGQLKKDRKVLLAPDDSGDRPASAGRIESVEQPLIGPVARRHHPYARPASQRVLLPPESDSEP